MFSAQAIPPRQLLSPSGDVKAARLGKIAAAREAADHEPVGLSVGGVVLVTAVTILGACGIALPFTYGLTGWVAVGCWLLAVVYILLAAHWLRVMLDGRLQSDHASVPNGVTRQ